MRILECNGRVFCLDDEPGVHRVWLPDDESPGLAMSRAFGDYCVKGFGLISEPEVTQRSITRRDQFIILATDGVHSHKISPRSSLASRVETYRRTPPSFCRCGTS